VKQKSFLVVFDQSSGNLLHLSRRCLTSFERRLSEEFEEPLAVLVKSTISGVEYFL
jgi:hypothetical protein